MIKKGIGIMFLILVCNMAFAGVQNFQFKKDIKDSWFGFDKLKHLSSSFVLSTTMYYVQTEIVDSSKMKSIRNASLITVSFGLGKEIYDSKKPSGFFSLKDLTVDVAGAGLAALFIQTIR